MRIGFVLGSIVVGLLVSASPGQARYGFCQAQIPGRTTPIPNQYSTAYPSYLSEILDFGVGEEHSRTLGRQFSASVGQPQGATCYSHFADAEAAIYYKAQLLQKQAGYHVETGWNGGFAAAALVKRATVMTKPEITRQSGPDVPKRDPAPSKYVEVASPDGPIRLSPEVAARNEAAADDYRRKMDEHARAKTEHDQRLAQHRQNAATAASATEQYKREVASAAERVAAHRLAMADHAKQVAGASTNDDPNTCITRPEFRSNDGFPGNTSASVINGCPQKVDIVLCLKRTAGDWTCGAKFGILTQGKMTYSSRNATGEIFLDAITYGGGGKLKRPAGM